MENLTDRNSAVYFLKAGAITEKTGRSVKMQVFQRTKNAVLAGVEPVIGLFDELAPEARAQLTIKTLNDGDIVQPWEPVMTVEGPYYLFAHLESIYLGIFARCTRVATNTRRVVEAANGKDILFFADRFDLADNQAFDGYATAIGGASAVCTQAMADGSSHTDNPLPAIGTMPHPLIAYFDGDVVQACQAYREQYPDSPLVALVDFNNDCVEDSIRCLKAFGKDLKGVRLDTGGALMDQSLVRLFETAGEKIDVDQMNSRNAQFRGVNKHLVGFVRSALDLAGGQHVEIIVSGGFTADKIARFEQENVPADKYAVGSSLLKDPIDFTADLVRPVAKVGRSEQPSDRLELV